MRAFWIGVLGYEVAVNQPGDWMVLRDPAGMGPSIELQVVPEPKVVKNRVHLDLIPLEGKLEAEMRRLESLGARRMRYVKNDPDELCWIMADPGGNEFCCSRPPWEPRPARPEESSAARDVGNPPA